MDLEIREFTQAIVNFVNNSKLPLEVKRLSLHDICTKVDAATEGVIKSQLAERERAEKEKETKSSCDFEMTEEDQEEPPEGEVEEDEQGL